MHQKLTIEVEILDSDAELTAADLSLLDQARCATKLAYAPYSKFNVGAAAILSNGKVLLGSNQENASFGATICAERVLLSSLAVTEPGQHIATIAISYNNTGGESDKPISPCGICRQSLLEHETNAKYAMRIIMSGLSGKVWIINGASVLLPLGFTNADMQ